MIFFKTLLNFSLVNLLFINILFAQELIKFNTNIEASLKVNADSMFIDKVSLEGGLSG